jgi:cytochrome c oxidase assembly factor CtaG
MELIFNTANPLMIIAYVLFTSLIIFTARKSEQAWPLIITMIYIVGLLIYHSITLDGLEKGSAMISTVYHCIAMDLILVLLVFMSYLWVDDIIAKRKKIKSYDDSLSWFWNKI